jgi:hypothetical protein
MRFRSDSVDSVRARSHPVYGTTKGNIMPLPPKRETQVATTAITTTNERELSEVERDIYIQRADFSGLTEQVRAYLCSYISTLAGLDPRMGYVICINVQGRMVPIIRAAGIAEIARSKVKSLRVTEPKFIFRNSTGGSAPLAVSVVCTVETIDGKVFEDIGCVDCGSSTAIDAMKASTRARSRTLKLAVGVHLMSEEELNESRNIEVKKEKTHD